MKLRILTALMLFSGLSSAGHALEGTVYLGGSLLPLEFVDGQNFDVSDWQNYPNALEGRVRYNLAPANGKKLMKLVKIGYEEDFFTPWVRSFLEADLGLFRSDSTPRIWMAGFGLMARPVNLARFKLSIGGKVSWANVLQDLGTAKQLPPYPGSVVLPPTYVDPVILPIGTFRSGDAISAQVEGLVYQALVNVEIFVTKDVALMLEGGWAHSDFGELHLRGGDVNIPRDNLGVVKSDGSYNHVNIDPRIRIDGPIVNGALVYHFKLGIFED